jgi:hypothetical protein
MVRLRWLASAFVLAAAGGCGGGGSAGDLSGAEADDSPDVALDVDVLQVPDGGWPTCTPGTRLQCTDDNLGEVLCNLAGTGWEEHPCGDQAVCLDPQKGCSSCVPGRVSCLNDTTVIRCDPSGTQWDVAIDCDPARTGEVCRSGLCVGLCALSDKLHSYIGCEYWGADLDNALVDSGDGKYLDAAGAQFAIVVSNTSPAYPAVVEIFTHLGKVTHDSNCNPLPAEPVPPMTLRAFELPRYHLVDPTKCEVCKEGPGQTYPGKDCMEKGDTVLMDVDGTSLKPQAYRVKSSIPITAYQFNPFSNVGVYSNDASLLLPSNALGKNYVIMTREQTFQDLKGFLSVVGVDPGETQVYIKVTAPTLAGSMSDGGIISAMKPGDEHTFVLHQFDILNIETNAYGADLTGSIVYASHPVGVFGGSEAANAPNTNHCCPNGTCTANNQWMECAGRSDCLCEWPKHNLTPSRDVKCSTNYDCYAAGYNTCCADHLEKMLYPVKTWGLKYIITRSYPRGGEKDVVRVMAAEDQTKVTMYPQQGTLPPVLNQSEYLEFESDENFVVLSKKPVLVGQFLAAQDAPDPNKGPYDAGTGDPTFLLAVPAEQFRQDYVFLTPDKYRFDAVNLIVPTGEKVFLDGKELKVEDLQFRPAKDIIADMIEQGFDHPSQLGVSFGDYRMIGDGEWSVWRVVVPDGVHVATSGKPFGVTVYGYDRYVSYGYPAGLNLEDLNLVTETTPPTTK